MERDRGAQRVKGFNHCCYARARGMVRKERACASARFQRDSTPDPALAIHFGSSLFALSNDGNAREIILVSILSRNQARNSMTRSEG